MKPMYILVTTVWIMMTLMALSFYINKIYKSDDPSSKNHSSTRKIAPDVDLEKTQTEQIHESNSILSRGLDELQREEIDPADVTQEDFMILQIRAFSAIISNRLDKLQREVDDSG
ncbi:uncharacterized protein LOC132549915 [Ylistrum balloti]|uniref:uncharacterized protein LOC132549915 n=1 Tax=Ylistrum balloti TaxID=509963 RepID=UPI00290580A3|nr:uncharacterized protein LOC132549915 [Ylistrum balloti]XP_060069884.1 uncharacterized protein LOC132549915 [Ylistrum balloti]XP_060069885.1 uncharacterized protein LOC132549915 [Ylistrum balloti]